MEDAFLCRYGNQCIFKIRNLNRPLTVRESFLFRMALKMHMDQEFKVRDDGSS